STSEDTDPLLNKVTFSAYLRTLPAGNVRLSLLSSDTSEATVSPDNLTFTSINGTVPQTVTVTGADDGVKDGSVPYTVYIAVDQGNTADAAYLSVPPRQLLLVNDDDDFPSILIVSEGNTSEAGASANVLVRLQARPDADVTVTLQTTDTGYFISEGYVGEGDRSQADFNVKVLTFTSSNWEDTVTVQVNGMDDDIVDGNVMYGLKAVSSSSDTSYEGLTAQVDLVNLDDDDAVGIVLASLSDNTFEPTGQATFSVSLNSQPTSTVTVSLATNASDEATVSPSSMIFTSSNWGTVQTATLTGVDDGAVDGDVWYVVQATAASSDTLYSAITASMNVQNLDDDVIGLSYTEVSGPVSEAGTMAYFDVKLRSVPTASVVLALSSGNTGEVTVYPSSLTFTTSNWKAYQRVFVVGVDDAGSDGDQSVTITAAAASTDTGYNGLGFTRSARCVDDESAGTTYSTEYLGAKDSFWEGGSIEFSVVLNSTPSADVQIDLALSGSSDVYASASSLNFTAENYASAQSVIVYSTENQNSGNETVTLSLSFASSQDLAYKALSVETQVFTVLDNDGYALMVSDSSGHTGEDGTTATFTVRLTTAPSSSETVTVYVASDDATEGTPGVSSLAFTAYTYATPQTVTVTGVGSGSAGDSEDDGDMPYNILLSSVSSSLGGASLYNGIAGASVVMVNDEIATKVPNILVSEVSGRSSEQGRRATFTVRLRHQPTATVNLAVSSSDTSEATLDVSSLQFKTSNNHWKAPQTVTVTGVDDSVIDGNKPYRVLFGKADATDNDPDFEGLWRMELSMINTDDETVGLVISTANGTQVNESGSVTSFTVKLASMPIQDVVMTVTNSDNTEASVSPASLTFTSKNWNQPQSVYVTGVDDGINDGNQTSVVTL
ncbi:MAG: hypothetical protein HQL31_11620, partial [Planctomycetes bacterium]|nr:hypothetical protein [Planctomycetota bacterium]